MIRRLATSADLLQRSIRREEEEAAAAGARFSPTRRMRTAAVMERLEERIATEAGDGPPETDAPQTNEETDEEGSTAPGIHFLFLCCEG